MEPRECPECESWDTEVVHTEWCERHVERVRICNDCPAEYTISYGNPVVADLRPDAGNMEVSS